METFTTLTPRQLRRAADVKERIDALEKELGQLLGALAPAPAATATRKRKKISAAGIARMRAAQRARWAAVRNPRPQPQPPRSADGSLLRPAGRDWPPWPALVGRRSKPRARRLCKRLFSFGRNTPCKGVAPLVLEEHLQW